MEISKVYNQILAAAATRFNATWGIGKVLDYGKHISLVEGGLPLVPTNYILVAGKRDFDELDDWFSRVIG